MKTQNYGMTLGADTRSTSLGPEFQSYQAPMVKGVELSHTERLEVKLIDYDFAWSGEHKQEFQDKFANEVQNAEMDESGVIVKP